VLDLNTLAGTMRTTLATGDRLAIELVKAGENPGQAVGYLPDGTMVVVEQAADRIGDTVQVTISNTLQTSAGRLIFAKPIEPEAAGQSDKAHHGEIQPPETGVATRAADMARAATEQPRVRDRPKRHDPPPPGRNPRR